jgi:thiamine-phosphate pyrophosphorylase
LSTHAPSEVTTSTVEPVNYISAGPVVATPTKPGRTGTGTDYISLAVRTAALPVFVTGGVSPETVPGIAEAGARHFVVVRYLTEADDPGAAARRLRDSIDRALDKD